MSRQMIVEKVNYQIRWRDFKRGYSLFIPCVNCIQAKQEIYTVLKRFRIEAVSKITIESGIRGLRLWCL